MFRALSMFQLQQQLLKTAVDGQDRGGAEKRRDPKVLFPPTAIPGPEVGQRIADLMQTLRPMLVQALAACTLH